MIDALRLNRREREALDRVLPQISGERVLHALETLGALELSRVPQLLGAGLLDDAAARRALADPGLLPVALRCRDRGLLAAAARTAAGPAMINRALSELDDPGFAVAVGTGSAPESWLDVSAADANLVARLLACGVSFGTFLPLGGKDPRRTVLRALRHVALDTGPRPSVAAVATAATAFLDLRSLQLPDVELRCRLVRALALGAPEELDDDGIWCSALELGWAIPDAWVQHRLETVDGALGLASVSEGSLGERLAGLAFAHGRGSVDVNGGIWGRALDAVARHDSRSAIELLGAMLERFVAEAAELEPLARFAAQLRDDSHLRVHQLLRLVVLGTAAPALNRHRRALRARLRQPLDGLSALLDRDDFALEPWTGPGWKSDYTALPRLLEFAYSPDELVRLLRTPDGRLGPFWHQAANAGVPTEALVALYHDVRKGRVAVVPGRGAPSEQEAAAHVETHGRARPPQLDLYGVLCERLDADDIAALPDSPDPDAEAPPSAGKHWIGSPGFRTYYWRFHRTLDDDDVLWGMLRSDSYPNGLDKRMAEFEGQQIPEINAATRTIDAPVLERVIAGSPGAPQTESRWHLLVGATLALDLSTEALFTLIDRYAHWELDAHFPEGGSGLHMPVHLFTRVIERDPGRAREWLVDRLRSDPGWFDSRPVAGWFEQVGCPPAEIETALERLCADGTCGATLLPALVRVGGDVGPWLARTETEAAALNVLTGDALGEEELVATLGALRRTPPVEALRRILRVKKDRAFSVLERGCQSWDPDARRGLWLAVGRAAGSHWQREAAWRRASGA